MVLSRLSYDTKEFYDEIENRMNKNSETQTSNAEHQYSKTKNKDIVGGIYEILPAIRVSYL
jgi:hypothetical protein